MKSKLRNSKRQEMIAAYILLAPDVLGLLLIYVVPMAVTIYLSFHAWNGFSSPSFVGIGNYLSLFNDPLWLQSMGITMNYVLLFVPLLTVGSLLLALLIKTNLPEIKLFRTIYFLPIVMPIIVAAIVWEFIYEPSYGIINYFLKLLGHAPHAWLGSQKEALLAVVNVSVWKQLGYYMIIFLAGLNDIAKEYKEASAIDGASPLQRFWYITLPLLRPTMVFVIVVNLITALQDFDQVYVLTRGGPNYATYVQVFYIYEKAIKFFQMGLASAASVILFSIILLLSLIQLKVFRGGRYD